MKTTGWLIKLSSTSVRFPIQDLMGEVKPVVAHKSEFEYRDVIIMIVLSEVSEY